MFIIIQVFTITRLVDISKYILQQYIFLQKSRQLLFCAGFMWQIDVPTCFNEAFGETKIGNAWHFGYSPWDKMKHEPVVVSVAPFSTNMQERTISQQGSLNMYHYIKIHQYQKNVLIFLSKMTALPPGWLTRNINTSQLAFQRFTAQRTNNQTCYCLTSVIIKWMKGCESWDDDRPDWQDCSIFFRF